MNKSPSFGGTKIGREGDAAKNKPRRNDDLVLGGFVGLGAFVLCQCVNIPSPWKGMICFFCVLLVQFISRGCFKLMMQGHNQFPPPSDNWGRARTDAWGGNGAFDEIENIGEAARILREFKTLQGGIPEPDWILNDKYTATDNNIGEQGKVPSGTDNVTRDANASDLSS